MTRRAASIRDALVALLGALLIGGATQVPADHRIAGTWLFDKAPSYPGVTMLQLADRGGTLSGRVTTAWYGAIPLRHPRLSGRVLSFDLPTLNDPRHATRRWTAVFAADGVDLRGDIWSSHVEQRGRRGTAREVAARTFHPAGPLPPLRALPPDGLAATPPMGWSSWNRFADRIDDASVRAIADAMVRTGLRDVGYRYVNIDDGWQGRRDAAGVLHPNARFPNMRALADYIHARGLKLGLYSSPGPKTCAGYTGSYGHVRRDAATFAAWGIDYLKYDLCSGEWFYADADSVRRAYQEMALALRETGRPIVFSLCEYGRFDVAAWGRSVGGHLWRTTGDITDDYATMAGIGFDRNPAFRPGGPGGWNDPDMLEVGNGGMTDDEYRTHLTLWAMQAAPLLMGNDLRAASPATLALLGNRGVVAIDQDADGIQGRRIRRGEGFEVWRRPLAGGAAALALFNRSPAPLTIVLDPADMAGTRGDARDVWRDAPVEPTGRSFAVAPHGVVLLRIG